MSWEFVSIAIADDGNASREWRWRRLADDAQMVLSESAAFPTLEACIADAREHGFVIGQGEMPGTAPGPGGPPFKRAESKRTFA